MDGTHAVLYAPVVFCKSRWFFANPVITTPRGLRPLRTPEIPPRRRVDAVGGHVRRERDGSEDRVGSAGLAWHACYASRQLHDGIHVAMCAARVSSVLCGGGRGRVVVSRCFSWRPRVVCAAPLAWGGAFVRVMGDPWDDDMAEEWLKGETEVDGRTIRCPATSQFILLTSFKAKKWDEDDVPPE
eukprot:4896018-Prymnesium_polylepis.1